MTSQIRKLCAYQLKISLKYIRPPIWRRLLVRSDTPLGAFHDIIQMSMGWDNYHLHCFTIHGASYGTREDSEFAFPMVDNVGDENEDDYVLGDFDFSEKDRFQYEYDFGDAWLHDILVEKVLPVDPKKSYPVCLKGKRACPPEDCGGPWGYPELLDAIANPDSPNHKDTLEWLGDEFDPEEFDIGAVNAKYRRRHR